jgi:hypothetical protein
VWTAFFIFQSGLTATGLARVYYTYTWEGSFRISAVKRAALTDDCPVTSGKCRNNAWNRPGPFYFPNSHQIIFPVYALYSLASNRIVKRNTEDVTPCSPLQVNVRFEGTFRLSLQLCFLTASRFTLRPRRWRRHILPKRRLTFQRTTLRYFPEERTVRNRCCENRKSYVMCIYWEE